MIIIGITGTLGAGKGAIVDYLVKEKGFVHFSAREFLFEEIDRRSLARNRDSLNIIGENLRKERGASYVIDSLYERAERTGKDAIIESVRTVGEVESLKAKGGYLVAVEADPHVRYKRVALRGSETDQVSFGKFIADEKRESEGNDPARMNIPKCIESADFHIQNDGSFEDLARKIEKMYTIIHAATKSH